MPSQPAGTIRMIALGTFKDQVFSPDGTILYASHGGAVTAYNVATGAVVGNWTLGTTLGGIDISTDGHTLVATDLHAGPSNTVGGTTTTDYYVYKLDTGTGTETTFTTHVTGYTTGYYDVAMLSNGQALLSQTTDWMPLTTLDLSSGTFTPGTQTYTQSAVLVASADHSHILVGPEDTSDAPLYIYTAGVGQTAGHSGYADNVEGYNNGVEAISPDGSLVVQRGLNIYDGNLHFITTLSYPEVVNGIAGMAFSPDSHTLYLLDANSRSVVELETTHWTVTGQFSVEADAGTPYGNFGNNLLLSPDGHTLSVVGSAGIELINLSTVVPNGGTNGDDSIVGTNNADLLSGFGGNDTIDGSAGADTMYGGAGNDVFMVNDYGDEIVEYPQGGTDTVYVSINNYTLAGNVEKLILGAGVITATGNGGDELIQGNALDNILRANSYGTGSATILGADGNDAITGGQGGDSLDGGNGNDMLYGDIGSDTLTGGAGTDTFGGNLSQLSGDTITDLGVGDRVQIFSTDYASFTYNHIGSILKLGTSPVAIGNGPERLVVAQDSSPGVSGVDLVAANRMSGITDFDGDGHSDILWRNINGSVSTWAVTGNAAGNHLQASVFNGAAPTSWQIVETGDFNGDAVSDILWRNTNGQVAIWHGKGDGSFSADYLHDVVGTSWKIAGVGDLNGDGKDDLLWRNDNGALSSWVSNGSGFDEAAYTRAPVDPSWKVEGLADFNGDGKADILWRSDTGAISTWSSTGAGFNELAYYDGSVGTDWHIAALADFNGDGQADILWRHANGAISIWTSNGTGFTQAAYNDNSVGNSWHIAMVGDFNDDGKADILWRNDNGSVSTWESNGHGFNQAVANGWAPGDWSIVSHQIPL